MNLRHLKARALALATALLFASPALAAWPQIAGPAGVGVAPPAFVIVGFDSSTQAPCIVGSTATCQLSIAGNIAASTTVKATAAAPSYGEGSTTNPLSTDLAGNLRITGSIAATTTVKATAAAPSYTEGSTTNPISTDLAGNIRMVFSSTPTVNLGTLNGASTAANQATEVGSLATIATNTTGASTAANQTAANTKLDQLHTDLAAATPAGSFIIGKVGIDQTTPGTTNLVTTPAVGAAGSAVPSSASYTGANSGGNLTGIIQADTSKKIDFGASGTIEIVALAAGKKIYVTHWDVLSSGTSNFKFVTGTGTNCGTGTTDLTANYPLTAQVGLSVGGGLGPVLVIPAGQALCGTLGTSVQLSGATAYTQF